MSLIINKPHLWCYTSLFFLIISAGLPARPLILAHRGASGYLPEHTLEAKAYAYALGADYIEQDVVLTKDDVAIVLHDIYLDAVTDVAEKFPERAREDGRFYVIDFDWSELQALNVHERTRKDGSPTYPQRFPADVDIFRLHTLKEEIQLIQGLNNSTGQTIGICPEIKRSVFHSEEGKALEAITLETLNQYGYRTAKDPCLLRSFESEALKRLKFKMGCELRLVQLINPSSSILINGEALSMTAPEALKEIATYAYGVGPNLKLFLNPELPATELQASSFAEALQQTDLATFPYTFRDEGLPSGLSLEEIIHFFCSEIKPTGIMTDFPDRAMQMLQDCN